MSKTVFLFPGQASQYVGMGSDLYENYDFAKSVYDQANDIMGYDIQEISFNGPIEVLKQTNITQPAIFIHSYIAAKLLLEKGITPGYVAGHSLGEYTAATIAGCIDFSAGLKLVKIRGELMNNAGKQNPGTMAALMGPEPEQVSELCEKVSDTGIVKPANFNSPGQIVISGEINAVHKAMDLSKEYGVRKAVELTVSAAFHSPLMESAGKGLNEAIDNTKFSKPACPVVSNVGAAPEIEVDKIKNNLKVQLLNPVLWQNSMEFLLEQNCDRYYETGPGKVLQGLMKRINRKQPVTGIDTVEDINKAE